MLCSVPSWPVKQKAPPHFPTWPEHMRPAKLASNEAYKQSLFPRFNNIHVKYVWWSQDRRTPPKRKKNKETRREPNPMSHSFSKNNLFKNVSLRYVDLDLDLQTSEFDYSRSFSSGIRIFSPKWQKKMRRSSFREKTYHVELIALLVVF